MNKLIMHIDYDTFFASVEQQANPLLRGRPIAVAGSSLTKGVVCAASREAKRLGVKTGMPTFKARELCPDLIPVRGDGRKYSYIQKESLKIFGKYTDHIEPFSIDEAFLDITKTTKFFETAENMAAKIKEDIKQKFGEYITCSIGIGPNKLLAKLVSSLNKPNGIFVIETHNMEEVLQSVQLRDFCGIGPRLEHRLNELGIKTTKDLQNATLHTLYKEFGNVAGSFMKMASFGMNYGDVSTWDLKRVPKSISHQHTLSKNTRDINIILNNIRRLCEMVSARLRHNEMLGKCVSLTLRDANRQWHSMDKTLALYTSSGSEVYQTAKNIFEQMNWHKETRLVGIGISNLIHKKHQMLPLFPEDLHKTQINETIDKINDRWGSYTIVPAITLKADQTKHKISSFLKYD